MPLAKVTHCRLSLVSAWRSVITTRHVRWGARVNRAFILAKVGAGSAVRISIWPNNNLEGQTTISSFYHSFSTTLYNLACMYADEEMVDCGPNASNWIGITIDPSGLTATEGVVPVSSTNSAVVNDWVCTNSSGSQVTDSGSTVGCGADTYPVGVVTDITQFGATTPIIKIARGNGAGGGGGTPGGSPTQIQYNLGGAFAGIAGSAVDTSGDVTLAPTSATATAITITANTAEDAIDAYSTGNENFSTILAQSTATDDSGSGIYAQTIDANGTLFGSDATGSITVLNIEMAGCLDGRNPSSVEGIYFVPSGNPVGFHPSHRRPLKSAT